MFLFQGWFRNQNIIYKKLFKVHLEPRKNDQLQIFKKLKPNFQQDSISARFPRPKSSSKWSITKQVSRWLWIIRLMNMAIRCLYKNQKKVMFRYSQLKLSKLLWSYFSNQIKLVSEWCLTQERLCNFFTDSGQSLKTEKFSFWILAFRFCYFNF